MKGASRPKPISAGLAREAVWILILGLMIRIYACQYTHIINQDGTLYVHQARAIYYGEWGKIATCGTGFLSNYPFFIAGAYFIFHDWIAATKAVSLVFGSLTLVPLFYLYRRFFDIRLSAVATLIFAMMPVFVGQSADSIRDPVYWFFMTLGICFFTAQMGKNAYGYLLASSLLFLMAGWARIEALLVILLTAGYILFFNHEKKGIKLAVFFLPVALLILASFSASFIYKFPASGLYRSTELIAKMTGPWSHYQELRAELKAMAPQIQNPVVRFFLPEARNFVWLIALGTLVNRALEAYFYPLFIVFAFGFLGVRQKLKEDGRIGYFLLLVAGGIVLLYVHILHWWMIYNRFLAVIIFPSAVFAGLGLQRISSFLQRRFGFEENAALSLICALILISTLPKNLQPREADKLVFKEVGSRIASLEGNRNEISVVSPMDTIRWLSFYANLGHKGAPCPQPYNNFDEVMGKNYKEFIRNLRERRARYVLWDEKHWPQNRFDFFQPDYRRHFKEIGRWHHRDTGQMILYKFH